VPAPARIACLRVPDLPLRAELRARPASAGRPLVIATGREGRAGILSVSPEAAAHGIRPGRSVAYARAACAALEVRALSPALERAARDALLDVALAFAPRAEPVPRAGGAFACEGAVWVDAGGTGRIFGDEARFASALAARAERQGLPGAVGVAGSREVALLAARRLQTLAPGETLAVVAPGEEERFLAPLPIDLLDPDDRTVQTLTRFGVHRIEQLLALPREALTGRLGPGVRPLIDRARGRGVQRPLPVPRDRRLEEGLDLEHPVDRLEPLGFVLRGVLSRLLERLADRGLACGPLDLRLHLVDGGRPGRRVGVSGATDDVRVLLRLLLLALESDPPAAAVEGVVLATEGLPARRDQLDLFRPRGPDPAALDRTLSELEALCGEGRVGAPEVPDEHRPGGFALQPFTGRSRGRAATPAGPPEEPAPRSPQRLALRALRPPVRAEVRVEGGRPAALRSAVSRGHIVELSGPWRTTGRWWSEDGRYAVDHYDVQVSDGCVLRLGFDWIRRQWQVEALYD